MKVDVYNKKDSKVALNPQIWDIDFNEDLVTQSINIYLSNQRKGTAHSKTRSEVSGGGRKPWRQKGTGRARHGSIRSPIWVKGGVAFGPRSGSNWKRTLNKRMKCKAKKGLLSEMRRSNAVRVVDFPSSKKIKTIRDKNIKYFDEGKTFLFITEDEKEKLAFRNVENIEVIRPENINIFDIAKAEILVISKNAIGKLNEILIK